MQNIPVKLHCKGAQKKDPYEFQRADGTMFVVKGRNKTKTLAQDTFQWMIPSEVRQLVVSVKGDHVGQIYYILDYTEDGRECIARKHPKDSAEERFTIPIHTLAQIWKR